MNRIAIVDYGMGNLRSVAQALRHVAPEASIVVTSLPAEIEDADRAVLPGQGAMPDCMRTLEEKGLVEVVRRLAQDRPLLGVCLGEQMLCDRSDEGDTPGLGLIHGRCVRFPAPARGARGQQGGVLKVPHMGWNRVRQRRGRTASHSERHPLWHGIADDSWFYFVHSYHVVTDDPDESVGETEYGAPFTSAIARDNIFATQFHPEKSAAAGLVLYRNFVSWKP